MSKAKICKTNLAVRPPAMREAAAERKVLDEVARHVSSHHASCPQTACRVNNTARLADDIAIKTKYRDPRTSTGMEARSLVSDMADAGPGLGDNQSGSREQEPPEPGRKTAAHYCALFAVIFASALLGYLIRYMEASKKPSESDEPGKIGEGGMKEEGVASDEMQKLHYLAAA
ncbi:hypothetical protein CSPAE12_00690 [Colletotrichum incanum]|nr:hypothetical protein CSPAE12_00690 [Colletotrichum incanum]